MLKTISKLNSKVNSPVDIVARQKIDVRTGDTVRVLQKIEEAKGKFRLQAFEGLVLAVKHGKEAGGTFTVRKMASGVGVEKIFPLYSPVIDSIEIIRRAQVRRSKLYYIRDKASREVKRQMRHLRTVKTVAEETPAEEISAETTEVAQIE
ncbi:MAG: 50S ribosomal protein L19 [bacterium]|nr:50S ribosomal protein L19 [bacterium]